MTTVRLALCSESAIKWLRPKELLCKPSGLISMAYYDLINKTLNYDCLESWALDSGAFTAYTKGINLEVKNYIEFCKRVLDSPYPPIEIFTLDVIGDWKASFHNTKALEKAGIEPIPVYHSGEPIDVLKGLARDYSKIGLGGVARRKASFKISWVKNCFAFVWPKKIHGLGFTTKDALLAVPFHSVDASSWELGPRRFGSYQTFGKAKIRGSNQNLIPQINYYLKLQTLAQRRWQKQLKELDR